jgi:SpoVK/Ycf46/Vps4 family AAA+-type ATPase
MFSYKNQGNMGVLKNNSDKLNFVIAKRSDLVGKYLGHTAVKTQNLIDKCDGGVLFIDEVYSLGNNEKKDSFAKECIDTINLNLTEKKNFICIIAGYPEEIENYFFSYNPGLKRRFPFSYEITGYSAIELTNILTSKIHLSNWELVNDIDIKVLEQFIEKNKDTFNHFGGDIDTLLLNIKIVHGRRIFGKDPTLKKKITLDDIKKGYDKMMLSKTKNDDNEIKYSHMYS